jgi:hypothetical protein
MRDSKGRRANPRDKNDEAIDEALLIFSTLSVSAIEEFRKQSNSDSETSNLQCSDAAWSLCNQHAERERERRRGDVANKRTSHVGKNWGFTECCGEIRDVDIKLAAG